MTFEKFVKEYLTIVEAGFEDTSERVPGTILTRDDLVGVGPASKFADLTETYPEFNTQFMDMGYEERSALIERVLVTEVKPYWLEA